MTTTESTYDDFARKAFLSSGTVIQNFHSSADCFGEHCPVHKPSEHRYRDLPLDFDQELFMFLRILPEPVMGFRGFPDPDDYNYSRKRSAIMRNSIICDSCNDEIVSHHRHDFVSCSCGAVAVDGGHSYLKRVGTGYADTSVIFGDIDVPASKSLRLIRSIAELETDTTVLLDKRIAPQV